MKKQLSSGKNSLGDILLTGQHILSFIVHKFTCIDCSILTNPIGDQAETFYYIRPSHKSFTYTGMVKGKENIFCLFACYDNHQNKTHFKLFEMILMVKSFQAFDVMYMQPLLSAN